MIFPDGTVITKCDQCRELYGKRRPIEQAPCETCRVELMEENHEAGPVFQAARGQWIISGSGAPVDLSIPAVKIVMDLLEVKDQRGCLERVMNAWHAIRKMDNASGELESIGLE